MPVSILTQMIQNKVEELRKGHSKIVEKGHTVILISHRLSSLVQADRIFYLSHGKVVEKGPHRQLIQQNGPYQKLWNRQFPKAFFNPGNT